MNREPIFQQFAALRYGVLAETHHSKLFALFKIVHLSQTYLIILRKL